MCIRTTGTSQKFTILAQKYRINLEYMCRLSVVHHMVRQQCADHILGIYAWLYAILVPHTALIHLNRILRCVHFWPKMYAFMTKKTPFNSS